MVGHYISYFFIRALTAPVVLLPYRAIHALGRLLGTAAYYLMPNFRKRALSNLALASALKLTPEQVVQIAKESFQNLMITCLEYPKLAAEKDIHRVATCENPEKADALMASGKPVIFFCGHQANWEILFLEGTSRMPGVAIGRPIKNAILYRWVTAMREKFGGKMIAPKNAAREGLRGLKHGAFLGIVGDQGMPDSGYSSPFLGRQAWTSPLPAILSYRTGNPIIVATTRREKGKYIIHYSDPIFPDLTQPMEREIDRLMRASLDYLAETIRKRPGEWLWQHNRWKQQIAGLVKRKYRHDALAIILPEEEKQLRQLAPHLHMFREIYPHEEIFVQVPAGWNETITLPHAHLSTYEKLENLKDFRYKLVFNFTNHPLSSHFKRQATFTVVSLADLRKEAGTPLSDNLSQLLKQAICNAS